MRWLGRPSGHDRWAANLGAYVDRELSPAEAVAIEAHLEGCDPCRDSVTGMRAVKRLLAENLPEVRAARSFAITEAMLQRPGQRVRGVPPLAMRFAQATVAASVVALASLLVIDWTANGSDSAPMSAESGAATAGMDSSVSGGAASKGEVPGPAATAVRSQDAVPSVAVATGAPSDSASRAPAGPPEGTAAPGGAFAAPSAMPDSEAGTDWLRLAEVVLVFVALAALGGYAIAWRTHRRSSNV